MTEFLLVSEVEAAAPFAWYDVENDTICLTKTTDWFCPRDLIHEDIHAAINHVSGQDASVDYDNVASFVEVA